MVKTHTRIVGFQTTKLNIIRSTLINSDSFLTIFHSFQQEFNRLRALPLIQDRAP